MLDTYPRRLHGFAMSIWSLGMIMGPILGPTIGALLTEYYGWRYLFSINIPMGVAAFVAILFTLPEAETRKQALDWIGVTSLIVGVSCLQLVLDRGEGLDWFDSPEIIIEAVIAVLAMYIFVVHSLTHPRPYINLEIFKDRNFVVGLSLIFMFGIAVFSSLFCCRSSSKTSKTTPCYPLAGSSQCAGSVPCSPCSWAARWRTDFQQSI